MVSFRDPIHKDVEFSGVIARLISTDSIQRLNEVGQLGMSYYVYPSATHTRFSHTLGVVHLAGKMAQRLGVSDDERIRIQIGALYHDSGHPDFSHTFEDLLAKRHEEMSCDILRGAVKIPGRERDETSEILRSEGIDPEDPIGLITGKTAKPAFHHDIISHAVLDADRMDYLARDSYHTGASIGTIDIDRLLKVLVVHPETQALGIKERGISSVEQFLEARRHMYKDVYHHPSVFAAEVMLRKAASDSSDIAQPFMYGDGTLLARLAQHGTPSTRALIRRLRRGKQAFYTPAYTVTTQSASHEREQVSRLRDTYTASDVERSITQEIGCLPHEVIVTYESPARSRELSSFPVLCDDGTWGEFFEMSPNGRLCAQDPGARPLLTVHVAPELDTDMNARIVDIVKSV